MRNHGYQNYFDNEVLAATPWKLIEMLYSAALDSILAARRHIRHKDIPARARAINKALRIVSELLRCLNYEADGELSRRLAGIYRYVSRLLIEANSRQTEAPLAEAERLLSTLAEAWRSCSPAVREPEFSSPDFSSRDVLPSDAYPVSDAAAPAP
jgi:flagellar secretion chaperone FliS